jgi:hypothetical protein
MDFDFETVLSASQPGSRHFYLFSKSKSKSEEFVVRTQTYEEKDLEFFSSSRLRCKYVRSSTDLHLNVLHPIVSLV